jgi:hypothetical protein
MRFSEKYSVGSLYRELRAGRPNPGFLDQDVTMLSPPVRH